jgi:hypothetical protein
MCWNMLSIIVFPGFSPRMCSDTSQGKKSYLQAKHWDSEALCFFLCPDKPFLVVVFIFFSLATGSIKNSSDGYKMAGTWRDIGTVKFIPSQYRAHPVMDKSDSHPKWLHLGRSHEHIPLRNNCFLLYLTDFPVHEIHLNGVILLTWIFSIIFRLKWIQQCHHFFQ